MIPRTSKATIAILAGSALLFAAGVGATLWRISAQEKKTQALLAQAQQEASDRETYLSLRALQSSAQLDLEAFDRVTLSEDKLVDVLEMLEKAGKTLGAEVSTASVD